MKTHLSIFAIGAILASCSSSPQFTIKGSVDNMEKGKILIITNSKDTLASADIAGGKFTLEGQVAETLPANLVVENTNNVAPLILENVAYTVHLDAKNPKIQEINGGAEQAILNECVVLNKKSMDAQNALIQEYQATSAVEPQKEMDAIHQQMEEISNKFELAKDSLIGANPNSMASIYLVEAFMRMQELDKLEASFNLLSETARASEAAKNIVSRIEALKKVAIGQVAPDFTLATPEGEQLSMHSIKAKVKVIDFWASWCPPCRKENPHTVNTYNEYKGKGLEILGVSLDKDKTAWEKAIDDDKLTWKHVSDLKGWGSSVAQLYSVSSIPTILILDENNVIVAKNLRGDDFKNKIAEMLD